jgi:hypothetical protein
MNMATTLVRGNKAEIVKIRLVSAIEAVEEYQKSPNDAAKAQVMKRISLALAASGQL